VEASTAQPGVVDRAVVAASHPHVIEEPVGRRPDFAMANRRDTRPVWSLLAAKAREQDGQPALTRILRRGRLQVEYGRRRTV
jgi:hypothetical protein